MADNDNKKDGGSPFKNNSGNNSSNNSGGAFKNVALWLVIALLVLVVYNMFNTKASTSQKITYSEFLDYVENDKVKKVTIKSDALTGEFKDNNTIFETFAPLDLDLIKILRGSNVEITAVPPEESPWYLTLLISWLPIILLIGVWIFFMRQMQGGGAGKAFSFGKSKAKLLNQDNIKVTFKDVAGIDEAKEELTEIVEFLKDPAKFQKLGGRIPKGVLLVGSPGTGKTLLAKAVAGEAGVPFFSISGSDFVEMFVGVGAARVRDLFEQGKKNAPCIIFVDEIDAVGRHRGAGLGGGHDEREQTLNAMLVEMDGFDSNEGVILVAATNRPDVLDPALLRPGRFDRQVVVPRPDLKGRLQILNVHAAKITMAPSVDLEVIAKGTPGFSGADLANLINESALLAARDNKTQVEISDIERAKDKVLMGSERKSMVIPEKDKRVTAYHEAGHAVVAIMTKGADKVHKVSIIPRGMALGVTMQLPDDDRYNETKDHLIGMISVMLGGRIAEEVIFNSMSTGASNDIERLTAIARKMVMSWGMSDKLGTISFGKRDEAIFLGKEISSQKDYSERTAELIDDEVEKIIRSCYKNARTILEDNRKLLDALVEALMEKETIDSEEIKQIVIANAAKGYEKNMFTKSEEEDEELAKVAPKKRTTKLSSNKAGDSVASKIVDNIQEKAKDLKDSLEEKIAKRGRKPKKIAEEDKDKNAEE